MTQTFQKPQKSGRTAIYNARIVDPATKEDFVGGLLIEDGKIADFAPNLFLGGNVPESVEHKYDAKGNILCPSLIDMQVHFRQPGQEHKETLETGSKSAVAGGITTVVCQPNTKPVLDSPEIFAYLAQAAKDEAYCNVKAYGAISKGMKGEELSELMLLKDAGAVGFTDDGLPVMNPQLMRRAMEICADLGVPIAQHAEDLILSQGGCMNEGKTSNKLGLVGIPNASEAAIVARDILLQELTGCHYHVLHVSARQSLDFIKAAKARGQNVTCEAAPHHFILTDEAVENFNTNAKMNPPLRSEQDRAAIERGLIDGTIEVIATDHAPHDIDSKNKPMAQAAFGIVGVETMLPLSLRLYHEKKISLFNLLAKMTCNPARLLGIKDRGIIAKGAYADLLVLDIDMDWEIKVADFHSKSKNSPFDGQKVKGRAVATFFEGTKVYELI